MKKVLLSLATISLLVSGCKVNQSKSAEDIIGKQSVDVADGRFTPEVMWGMGKMGEAKVSPDGSRIAYTVTYYDVNKNKGNAELYVMNNNNSKKRVQPNLAKRQPNSFCSRYRKRPSDIYYRF